MEPITAQRTLVKSPPELWAQLSDTQELARHLGEFGEIRITRLEAERTVAWEGDHARGTVELEPSGWGTRVTLTAESVGSEVAAEADSGDGAPGGLAPSPLQLTVESLEPDPDPGPDAERTLETDLRDADAPENVPGTAPSPDPSTDSDADPVTVRRPGFFARFFGRRRRAGTPPAASTDQSPAPPDPPAEVAPPATVAGKRAFSQDPPLPAASSPERVEDALEPIDDAPEPVEDDPAPAKGDPPSPGGNAPARPDPELKTTAALLETVLDDLGAAHHRPFSRG